MKKILITLGASALATLNSQATLILSNSFGYADGNLTTVSAGSPLGVWTNHSGATPVTVSGEKVNLSQSLAEDVSTGLPGGPISNGTLYVSFKVNFSTVPTAGAAQYFFHFRDTGTMNFRGKVFATNSLGAVRVGVSVGGQNTPGIIPADLALGTEYKLVLRYNIDTTNATLWINPTSEASVVNRSDAPDTTSTKFPYYSACLRQNGGIGVLSIDDLLVGTSFSDVQTVGGPPSISGLVNVTIPANTNTGDMNILLSDVEDPTGNSLTLAATSDNPTLVPNAPANLTFGGTGNNRTLRVTPAASQQGTVNIEVVVTDNQLFTATNSFTITVGAPSISAIAAQSAVTNTPGGPIAFTVNDTESSPGILTVTATSSDQTVLPDANIGIQNLGGQNRTITFTNAGAGTSLVTVVVSDGTFNIGTTFTLTAYPLLGLVLGDDFSYADGPIVTTSSAFWDRHSGTVGETQVSGGKLQLTGSLGEDINALLTNAPYAPEGGFVFYARFIVNFSSLPTASGAGEYFAHFKETGTSQFRARISAITNGATPGNFRLGIARGGFTQAVFPFDLNLNTPYVVISRYNVATTESTLWVNPAAESSTSVSAASDGASTPTTIVSYAFRQQSGIGTLTVDDLKIGTSFSDVFTNIVVTPTPEPLRLQVFGTDAVLSWTNLAFGLQAAPSVTGTFTNVPLATSPYTNPITGSQKYFRLKN